MDVSSRLSQGHGVAEFSSGPCFANSCARKTDERTIVLAEFILGGVVKILVELPVVRETILLRDSQTSYTRIFNGIAKG